MQVWHFVPYDPEKNLGACYNRYMNLIPDGDSACIVDGDTCFLTPDFGTIIHEYANRYSNAVLTCYLNRIHPLSKGQLHPTCNSTDMKECIQFAESIKHDRTATPITGSVSGTLMVVPKHIWKQYPFPETNQYRPGETNMLGVDNSFTNKIRQNGIMVLRMNGLFLWHSYRLLSDGKDKSHLL